MTMAEYWQDMDQSEPDDGGDGALASLQSAEIIPASQIPTLAAPQTVPGPVDLTGPLVYLQGPQALEPTGFVSAADDPLFDNTGSGGASGNSPTTVSEVVVASKAAEAISQPSLIGGVGNGWQWNSASSGKRFRRAGRPIPNVGRHNFRTAPREPTQPSIGLYWKPI